MLRRFLLIISLSLGQFIPAFSADLKPDATTDIPASAKRPVVLTADASQLSNLKSQIPKAQLPEGMELTIAAAAPLVTHPIMGCLDDRGRLFMGDCTGVNWNKKQLEANPPNRVVMLEDTDKDGVFDKSTIFADKMTFPQGACWLDGSLYVCSPPGLWKLTDTNEDGVADEREMIVGGFEYTGNAADVHGPFLHPNGRLYWCHGRKGHKVVQKNGTLVHEGLASGIWSCKPDGSDVQWHSLASGDNPVEVDFTPEGEIIGTQNLYYSQPRGDTIVHWLYGGVYERPDQMKAIAGLPRTLETMPVMYNFGHVAVSGACFARSGMLFDSEADKSVRAPLHYMVTHFNTQRVVRMELTPDGATYKATEHEFLRLTESPDVHFTDVMEDADGSLLVVDTGGWFRIGCPSSLMAKPDLAGAVYRVKKKGATREALLAKEETIADKKVKLMWTAVARAPSEEQRKHDGWADPSSFQNDHASPQYATGEARARIQEAVSFRRKTDCGNQQMLRHAGRNALFPIYSDGLLDLLNRDLNKGTPEYNRERRKESDRLAAEGKPLPFKWILLPEDWELNEAERLATINALARIGDKSSVAPLVSLLRWNLSPQIEHAALHALIKIGDKVAMQKAFETAKNERQRPRLLLAIHEIDRGFVDASVAMQMAFSTDARASGIALRIAEQHPEWGESFVQQAEQKLDEMSGEAHVRNAFHRLALAFLKEPPTQKLVAAMLAHQARDVRQAALEVLAVQTGAVVADAWLPPLEKSLADAQAGDLPLLLDAIKKLKTDKFNSKLQAIADDVKRPLPLRLKALDAMKGAKMTPATFAMLAQILGVTVENGAASGSSLALQSRASNGQSSHDTPRAAESLNLQTSAAARIQAAGMLSSASLDATQVTALAPVLATAGPVELKELTSLVKKTKDAALLRTLATELAKNPSLSALQESHYRNAFADKPTETFETIVLPALRKANEFIETKKRLLPALAQNAAAKGKVVEGRKHFEAGKGTCIACHQIGSAGRPIGPDLSKIGAIRTERDLIESILFPSNTLSRDYEAHVIETSDGQSCMGVIKSHTAEGLLVVDVAGQEKTVPHANIVANTTLTTSLMPMGLDGTMSEQELCDLVAWLRSLR